MKINFFRNTSFLALLLSANLASAGWVASVDHMQINVNGSTAWNDTFSTDQSAAYGVAGNFNVNTVTGRATMDSDLGQLGLSGVTGVSRYRSRARRGVQGNTQWLNQGDQFLVGAVYDLGAGAIPDSRGRMGVALNDACGTCNNDDLVDIALRRNSAGQYAVTYRYNNDVRNPVTADGYDFVQNSAALNLTGFDQIVFLLRNDGQGNIEGGYVLLDSAAPADLSTLVDTATWFTDTYAMFNTEQRVRAELFNVKVAEVPEPSTYLLFGLGLVGLLVMKRRSKA